MFDIGWSELLLIGVVALIVIGPKELPGVLRTLGQWMTKVRRMANEFQNQFQDAIREAELAELKKEVDDMAAKAAAYTNIDPLEDVRKDIEKSVGELPSFDTPPVPTPPPAVPAAEPAPVAELAPPSAEPAPAEAAAPAIADDAAKAAAKPETAPDAGRAA
jgi:sec-independent protein translocase protein TatB